MKAVRFVLMLAVLGFATVEAQEKKTYTGIITDTMCGKQHTMGVTPQDKCVRDCVADGRTYKYALADANGIYTLSDQQTPAKFAGRKVRIVGVLYPKTNILKVESIAEVK